MSGEILNQNEQSNPQAESWESLQQNNTNNQDEFAGETNLNSATGKPRTFTQFDKFPRLEGETPEQSGARLKRINELNARAQEELYQRSERGEQERAAEAEYDRITAKLEQAVKDGRMSEDHARNLAEKQLEIFDKKTKELHQKFQEDQALQDWVDSSDVYKRADVLAEIEAAKAGEVEKAHADEVEKNLADEQEKEAALEAEKEGTFLEDAENVNPEQAEANKAEHQDAIKNEALGTRLESEENLSVAEAEAKLAEHRSLQSEALKATQAEAIDPRRLEALENHLGELRVELAELFVKKNRIFGPKHRAEYNEAMDKYEAALENYLRLKSKTDEELFQNYLEEDNKLLEDVDNQVDNGNFFRKIISRTLGNEYYKQAMHAHGARSLGVAGAESVRPNPNSRQPEATPAPSQAEVTPAASPEPAPAESTPESAPEPEPAPEPEASQTTEDSAEDTAEDTNEKPFEQAPASEPSPEERSLDETTRDVRLGQIRNYFYETPLNDEGYDIISLDRATVNDVAGQREIDNRIAGWWEGLDDEQKDRVRQYENDNLDSRYGGALRYWLQQHNEL